jgi:pyruvate dehydrogenase E2 component (dihydrolipoyllysine-residue acetyltransferase)
MAFPIRTPRVNNNDDVVRLSAVLAEPGARVRPGDPVCEVETDKATFSVEADREGYFLKCLHAVGDMVEVGSVLAWMGDQPDDPVPSAVSSTAAVSVESRKEPTFKAAMLLAEYGLQAHEVPATAERLRVTDVEAYIAANNIAPSNRKQKAAKTSSPRDNQATPPPETEADIQDLNVLERAMLRTVSWHRDEAVPGYAEVAYDTAPWEEYAARFQKEHRLLLNPLQGLMAFRLIAASRKNPKLNATIHDDRKHLYRSVNIGFTIQSGEALYLAVITSAEELAEKDFVQRLVDLQKRAMKNRLEPSQTAGATIAFTSMSRWNVIRHQPVLPPHTSFMVAHAAEVNGVAALGATYDHRLLTGADAVSALNLLKQPPPARDL